MLNYLRNQLNLGKKGYRRDMTDNEKIWLIEVTLYQVALNLMNVANGGNVEDFDTHAVAAELYKKVSESNG